MPSLLRLYRFFSFLVFPFFAFFLGKKGKNADHLRGRVPFPEKKQNGPLVWIHTLSVGEMAVVVPVLRALKEKRPDLSFYLSIATKAGFESVARQGKEKIPYDTLSFLPLDHPSYLAEAFTRLSPSLLLVTETGFWPNCLQVAKEKNVPVVLLHGRLSDKTFASYRRIEGTIGLLLSLFTGIYPKSEKHAARFRALLAESETKKVVFHGDTKFDSFPPFGSGANPEKYRELFRLSTEKVVVAGSTHAGEEEAVAEIFLRMQGNFSEGIVFIVAPRRTERVSEITALLRTKGIPFSLRSEAGLKSDTLPSSKERLILLDTTGELKEVYSIADLVFIGRSLFPPGGGHSVLEPAHLGKFTLFGPHFSYNSEEAEELLRLGVACQVADIEELEKEIFTRLKKGTGDYNRILESYFDEKRGASSRVASALFPLIEKNGNES